MRNIASDIGRTILKGIYHATRISPYTPPKRTQVRLRHYAGIKEKLKAK